MSDVIDTLVFDRTSADVEEVKTLRDKILAQGFDSLTPAEKTKYLSGMKGAYNYNDMNRVGESVSFVVNKAKTLERNLRELIKNSGLEDNPIYHIGIDTEVIITPKTDWAKGDTPTGQQCKTYIEQVNFVKGILPDYETPEVPVTLDYLTHISANNIEESIYMINKQLDVVAKEKVNLIKYSTSGLRRLAFNVSRKVIGNRRVS